MVSHEVMDVKSSWRKAIEEDEAEKIRQSAKTNDSVTGSLTPLKEPRGVLLSPDAPVQSVSCSVTPLVTTHSRPPVSQQEVLLKSTLSWDTFNTEALDSPSGMGSSAIQFTLDHETLPELPSCDSLLSLDDEEVDMKTEEDEDFVMPSLKTEAKRSPLATHRQLEPAVDGSLENRKGTPDCLLSGYSVSGLDRDWLMEPATPVEASDKVFSLDLDTLGTPSPSKKQDYSLPKLITFSPIDDMKC